MKIVTRKILSVALLILLSSLAGWAQCTEATKAQVDSLKASIPYPKYNIGDVLYIAFITNPKADSRHLLESDVDVYKVRIEDMRLINGFSGPDFEYGLYMNLQTGDPIEWEYQYVDASNMDPSYGDLSKYYPEDRFFTNPLTAKRQMLKRKK